MIDCDNYVLTVYGTIYYVPIYNKNYDRVFTEANI